MIKVGIITSSRADFGLLKNLIIKLKKDKNFKTFVIASGSHFSSKFGETKKEIIGAGIKINKKIFCNFNSNDAIGISKIISICITKSTKIFKMLKLDLIIVLGDRYEILGSVIAAHILNIPIAHLHGGEVTSGVIDDAFRHSITKMSNLHFVSHKNYKKRVIQLGENPKYVFNVGSLGIDNICNSRILPRKFLEKKFNLVFRKKNFLVTYHPETLYNNKAKKQIKILLAAIKLFKDSSFIFTSPGADPENTQILNEIKNFIKKNKNLYFYKSLGQENYFSLLKVVDGVIGNSSSGIIEMPYFKKGTINIGNRQNGRVFARSIINIDIKKELIKKSIKKITSKKFLKNIKANKNNIFGGPGAADKILDVLKKIDLKKIKNKSFFDIKFNRIK